MTTTAVMQLTDTLDAGGAERVAVNLANQLPRERYQLFLCTTRREGLLDDLVAGDVGRLRLRRRWRFDVAAVRRLVKFVRQHDVKILHAHCTSVFMAALASLVSPSVSIVWHDHFGRYASEERPAWLYRLATARVRGVIAVNQPLAEWSRRKLKFPAQRVWFIRNFVCGDDNSACEAGLPGVSGQRIACVANFRRQKDHLNLLRSMSLVIEQAPAAHLMLVGANGDSGYMDLVRQEIVRSKLEHHVSILGQRADVPALLRACDVGVLSSASEGLPLALIEYGMAGLPAVATQVGQCAEVLDDGRSGLLVPPAAPQPLAQALLSLLQSPDRRRELGQAFQHRARELYSPASVIQQVEAVYNTILDRDSPSAKP